MPWMIFIVSLLVSSAMLLTTRGVVDQMALEPFRQQSAAALLGTSGGAGGVLTLNEDVLVDADVPEETMKRRAFQREFFERSGEVALMDLDPDQAFDAVEVEYCQAGEVCPEVIVEWFQLRPGYRFQHLEEVVPEDFRVDPLQPCLDIPRTGIKRCVVRSSQGDSGPLRFRDWGFRFETDFSGYEYLLRFRVLGDEQLHYRVSGRRGEKLVALPQRVREMDQQASSGAVLRRVRYQELVSAGLQDGLGYVHASQEVENK